MEMKMRMGLMLKAGRLARAMREAESLVAYSSSMRSYRALVGDEMAGLALAMRKLIGVSHPLLRTVQRLLLSSGEEGVRARGLLVLLAARALNASFRLPALPRDGILPSQRVLAEVTETVYTAFALHRGILEPHHLLLHQEQEQKLGNKLAVLGGDYLLANASTAMARLDNPAATALIAEAIEDLSSTPLLSEREGWDWHRRVRSSDGSLLARSTHAALLLARQEAAGETGETEATLVYSVRELGSSAAVSLACLERLRVGTDEATNGQTETEEPLSVRQTCLASLESAENSLSLLPVSSATDALTSLLEGIREQAASHSHS